MMAAPGGTPPLKMAEGWNGARLRAAVDRLHAAQLAALAAQGESLAPALPASAPPAPPEEAPASQRDAHASQREALAQVDEMGSLLVLLGRLGRLDGEAAAVRRRLVKLAVATANALAELVNLAFELEGPGTGEAGAGARGRASGVSPPGP